MKTKLLIAAAIVASVLSTRTWAEEPANPAATTKATFLITGLHCPPCTRTVEGSLGRVKGVKSVSVDFRTQNAKIEYDESVLPAQTLSSLIAATPHMMGGGMHYGGWLALKVPAITDDASGEKAKATLSKMEGVKSVAVYPKQHSAAVLFTGKGSLSSQQMIEALAKEGIEASNF
jgi:copper chaperone CopZ